MADRMGMRNYSLPQRPIRRDSSVVGGRRSNHQLKWRGAPRPPPERRGVTRLRGFRASRSCVRKKSSGGCRAAARSPVPQKRPSNADVPIIGAPQPAFCSSGTAVQDRRGDLFNRMNRLRLSPCPGVSSLRHAPPPRIKRLPARPAGVGEIPYLSRLGGARLLSDAFPGGRDSHHGRLAPQWEDRTCLCPACSCRSPRR
jgi:hypothetical protein